MPSLISNALKVWPWMDNLFISPRVYLVYKCRLTKVSRYTFIFFMEKPPAQYAATITLLHSRTGSTTKCITRRVKPRSHVRNLQRAIRFKSLRSGGFVYRLSRLQSRAENFRERQILGNGKFWGAANYRERTFWKRQILGIDKYWEAANFEERQILGNGQFWRRQILGNGKFWRR